MGLKTNNLHSSALPPTVTCINLSFQFCRLIQYCKIIFKGSKLTLSTTSRLDYKPFNSKFNHFFSEFYPFIYYFIHVSAESGKGRYVLYIDSEKKDKFIYCVVYSFVLAYRQADLDA